MSGYLPRLADGELAAKLSYAGAVAIRGPKWCGKTSTAEQQAQSAVFLQDPDERANNLEIAEVKPSLLLQGPRPRLIDEWQEAPQLWDAVRFAVDRAPDPGQFMLTGSSTPRAKPRHSGTGRFSFLDMRTMSLFESGDSTGEVSLAALFAEKSAEEDRGDGMRFSWVEGSAGQDVEDIAYLICRGGWPRAATMGKTNLSLRMPYDYLAAIENEDISLPDGVVRNPQYARVILQAYARCTATQADMGTVRSNLKERGSDLSRATIHSYVGALRGIYALEDLPAWTPSLHAKSRITTTPVRFFTDPSIAAAALGATPDLLLKDMSTCGMLFENLCVRDLRVYAEPLGGAVMHYHDSTGLEADAVVTMPDGSYALFEMKMSARLVDEAAHNLTRLASKIDVGIMGAPAFCAVLTPGGYARQRKDGVLVIPVTCLAP